MKQILVHFIAIFLLTFGLNAQNCIPTDACSTAPKICMNGLITTTAGFSAGGEPITCPNGQAWGVHNDQWIAFMPALPNVTITVDVIGNCSSGNGVQALIQDRKSVV